jgi:hypothetical protein
MTSRQLNKLGMFLAVRSHCALPSHAEAVAAVPAFAEQLAALDDTVSRIRHLARLSLRLLPGGITGGKAELRDSLADAAARLSAALVTWADVRGDRPLLHAARLSRSAVLGGRELEAADRVDNLLALARAHAADLVPYGISGEQLDDLDDLLQSFSETIGRPRHVIREGAVARRSLADLFATADLHLARLDRLATVLEPSHPAFVAAYRAHRRVVNLAASREVANADGSSPDPDPVAGTHGEPEPEPVSLPAPPAPAARPRNGDSPHSAGHVPSGLEA